MIQAANDPGLLVSNGPTALESVWRRSNERCSCADARLDQTLTLADYQALHEGNQRAVGRAPAPGRHHSAPAERV
jgi:hypothetical protein